MLPQVNTTAGAVVTVKFLVQLTGAAHELAYVQVTATVPPQIDGADEGALLVNTPLHPELAVVLATNAAYAASTADCVEQEFIVTSLPQVNTTAGAGVTLNVLVHV